MTSTSQTPKPRQGKKRWWLRILLGVTILIILLVLLAPTLLSTGPGKSVILGQVNKNLRGRVDADGIAVGWFSPVSIRGLRVLDPEGQEILLAPSVTTQLTALKALSAPTQVGDVQIK